MCRQILKKKLSERYTCDFPLRCVQLWVCRIGAGVGSDCFLCLQCQLIVCQMSSTRCQPLNWMLLPIALVLFVVVSGFAPSSEALLLYLLTAFLTLAHIHYGVVVVGEPGTWAECSGAAPWGRKCSALRGWCQFYSSP